MHPLIDMPCVERGNESLLLAFFDCQTLPQLTAHDALLLGLLFVTPQTLHFINLMLFLFFPIALSRTQRDKAASLKKLRQLSIQSDANLENLALQAAALSAKPKAQLTGVWKKDSKVYCTLESRDVFMECGSV